MPKPGEGPAPRFPETQRAKLSNGMEVVLAERHGVPVVNMNLLVNAGFAADQFAQPGTAALAMNMLDEGTKAKNSIEISKELASLGATLGAGSNLDTSTVALSTLKSTLDRALNLYADVILNPAFPQSDFDRLQKLQIASIQREKSQPIQMGLRVFPRLLYGAGHAYGNPYTGSGTEESVAKLRREDLVKFHETWFKPNNATLVVVGDTTMAEMRPKPGSPLLRMEARASARKEHCHDRTTAQAGVVYLVDKPGAIQSGHRRRVGSNKGKPRQIAIESMNTVLGGAFIRGLNLNLRENKHWSYGAGSFNSRRAWAAALSGLCAVQTDKTKESVVEITKELRGILKYKLITADELAMAKSYLTQALPGLWETNTRRGRVHW